MPLPTIHDSERAFARTEMLPEKAVYHDASRHCGCLVGACVIEQDGPLADTHAYRRRMAELYDISTSEVAALEAGFDFGISGGVLDAAQYATLAFRRGFEIGRHLRRVYRLDLRA